MRSELTLKTNVLEVLLDIDSAQWAGILCGAHGNGVVHKLEHLLPAGSLKLRLQNPVLARLADKLNLVLDILAQLATTLGHELDDGLLLLHGALSIHKLSNNGLTHALLVLLRHNAGGLLESLTVVAVGITPADVLAGRDVQVVLSMCLKACWAT